MNPHFAGGLPTQIAGGSVDCNAVGGGFAAANRIAVHRFISNLCTESPGKVWIHRFAKTVYGRGPERGLL